MIVIQQIILTVLLFYADLLMARLHRRTNGWFPNAVSGAITLFGMWLVAGKVVDKMNGITSGNQLRNAEIEYRIEFTPISQ